ncbi:cytochrome P450 [Neolentinus lepideus HHB14362 ss-1]|uniref:Cytochrome P450 n=1 Tax=Neolentinus lepideus HHB14362 ss-1 TaxID=1314782 RepID=A0A165PV38_9AGAM|nr:cytochrome P450 [Neolentinus lepideus HHB14362 ss-1]
MELIGTTLLVCFLVVVFVAPGSSRRKQFPPGPKGFPLIGNIFDLSLKELWLSLARWASKYGDIVYIHVFGTGLVFLNDAEAAVDLMDRKGSIYSDRPHLVMAGELCGGYNIMSFTGYNNQFRRQRRLMQRALTPLVIKNYHPLLEMETIPFLKRLLSKPTSYVDHIRRYAGTLTLNVIYGHQVTSDDDRCLKIAEACADVLANDIAGGGFLWLVDVLPFLRHLPMWVPGSGFKHKAIRWKAQLTEFATVPYEEFKEKMENGTAKLCYCSTLVEAAGKSMTEQDEFDIKYSANTMYSASLDTTITIVTSFMLCMVQNPDVRIKAQAEIDRVVGKDRLPDFNDRPSLPYLECVLSEVFRWTAPVPYALPHRLMQDDMYRNYFIPRGSFVFANIWTMTRNEEMYPNADAFVPGRFEADVDEEVKKKRDPRNFVFGFGRRRCPGLYLAEQSTWLLMASMLAALDIQKAVDDKGKVIDPEVRYENSVFRMPAQFKMDIRPREHARKLMNV